jgi:hypothetical protein
MKKIVKTLAMLLVIFVSLFWGLHSCTKTTEVGKTGVTKTEIGSNTPKPLPMTNQEITSLAKSIGYLHNALIDKVAREVNLVTISKEDYKKAFYATKI